MALHTNRLARETSPYLLQHARNPVDWFPWGDEAFRAAREQKKPVLVSIGYSACHWCHVMERESFENEEIARVMNEHFINIKVDREERPDVDEIYMNAVQLMTGQGGWPLTMFLTPDGEPYFGGTYFPPEDRHGMPGFPRVLRAAADAYRSNAGEVRRIVGEVRTQLAALARPPATPVPTDPAVLADLARRLLETYDPEHGGFGRAPKFPHPDALAFLLRTYAATQDRRFLEPVLHTLRAMARGGIYDHLGGGFHRYSTDARWQVPHFEKMLYDNALLPRVYLEAYQITGDAEFRRVVEETIGYLLREMAHTEGGFFAAQDADSEGEEGRYFVWTPQEIESALGAEGARIFCRYYGVTDVGNFEGRNILHGTLEAAQLAKLHNVPEEGVRSVLDRGRRALLEIRGRRIPPARDDKIILAWNGLTLSFLAEAYRVLGDRRCLDAAERTVRFVESHLRVDGAYRHSFKDGPAPIPAYLDDHAFYAEGLLDLYEATLERAHLDRAREVAEQAVERFEDRESGGFFSSATEHRTPMLRTKPTYDGALPSGNSVLPHVLLRLYHYTYDERHLRTAERALSLTWDLASRQPFGACRYLAALDFCLRRPWEIFLLAEAATGAADSFLDVLRRTYLPNRCVRWIEPGSGETLPEPLRGKKQIEGRPTVYLCRNFTCSPPVTSVDELRQVLGSPQVLPATTAR